MAKKPNPLMGEAQAPAAAPSPFMQYLHDAHGAAQAQWDKISASTARLAAVRGVLDELTLMGDNVTTEDLVKGAGKLVDAGLAPVALAGLLADAPETPAALAGWVKQQDARVTQQEAAAKQAETQARHQLGVSSLRVLMGLGAEHASAGPNAMPGAPAAAANPLVPMPGATPNAN